MAVLTQTRCFNHGAREAVARCPGCHRHFCRECVTEHDHRLLCASCLAAEATAPAEKPRRAIPFAPLIQLGAAVFVLWMTFFVLAQALLLIPSKFHDNHESAWMAPPASGPEDDAGTPPRADGDGEGAPGP